MQELPKEPKKLEDKTAVWGEFGQVCAKYKMVSLAEGAPFENPEKYVKDQVMKAFDEGANQYCRTFGHPELVKKIAEVYGPRFKREINPLKEILVTPGANGALHSYISGFVNEGDEVAMFDPQFPMYLDHIRIQSGVVRSVPLDYVNNHWTFSAENVRAALSPKTKLFIFNNPHNPTGKNFTLEEMELLSSIFDEYPNLVVLSDEVYDFLTFENKQHILFATVKNNWQRTISIFSGGKLFSATGWKVGWSIARNELLRLGAIMSNTIYYCTNVPVQVAFSRSLEWTSQPGFDGDLSYVQHQRKVFQETRDLLVAGFKESGLPVEPMECEGGYFFMMNISKCRDLIPKKYFESHEYEEGDASTFIQKNIIYNEDGSIPLDLAFCRWIAMEKGVMMMPGIIFYDSKAKFKRDDMARVAICRGLDQS